MDEVRSELSRYPEAKVVLRTPPVIPGLGTSGGFEMVLEARGEATLDNLRQASDTLIYYAGRDRRLNEVSSSLQPEIPQLYFDVDRDQVKLSGVPLADVFSTMKTFTGSVYVNDFNMFNRIYRVYIQAEGTYRAHKDDINMFYVRGTGGVMIPLTALGTAYYTTGPGVIKRFNMFNSATITGEAAQGQNRTGHGGDRGNRTGEAAGKHRHRLERALLSGEEGGRSDGLHPRTGVRLRIPLSRRTVRKPRSIPIAIMLSLPVAVLGAYLGVWICGLENNAYFQIGLVMLMGLVAKNAILIVEFAQAEVKRGVNVTTAAIHAARLRFRPILMTSLAFILGMVPLVLASGPGSSSRQDIGTGVFFGMIVAIIVGIVLVPFFFVMIHKFTDRLKKKRA